MVTAKEILNDITNKNLKPIYLLMGNESYYIDKIVEVMEKSILNETEKQFDQTVVYGNDIDVDQIQLKARSFPMIAERQLIILKEIQMLKKGQLDALANYASNFQDKTILVLCYKHGVLNSRSALFKAINKVGVVFESKEIYDSKIPDWIINEVKSNNYTIDTKAAIILNEFLGNDLSKIVNELEKLMLVLPTGSTITPEHIEENIGFSKDFNNFELKNAIAQKDILKANRIINYFAENQKKNHIIPTIALLYSYFTQLFKYHTLSDKSIANLRREFGPYYFDIKNGASNYPMRKISQIISWLREADVKSKGVDAISVSNGDLLKELLFKILH